MATYIIIGHPLNYADLDSDILTDALRINGIGTTITLTLPAPLETQAKDLDLIQDG